MYSLLPLEGDLSHQLHASLARILTPEGTPVGIGFLAAENMLITCAHVIQKVVGDNEIVSFDLPLLALGERLSRRVLFSGISSY